MRISTWLVLCLPALMLCGCGESGPERIGVSGEVTYNGEPVVDGEISFHPEAGTEAPPSSTTVTDGKYQLSPKWSLMPGTYKVAFRSYKVSLKDPTFPGSDLDRPPSADGIVLKEQLLPEKFNTESPIKLSVKSGDKSITQNYDLKDEGT